MKQTTRGLQDFAFCWTVRISGARCPLFQLRKGPHAWIPHPLRHLEVRLPGIWFSLEVMSRPRELIPRLEASGQNHRGLSNLVKDNGRIRGIVTDDTFRRGVARTMAQQCAKKFEEECMPFQYALSTRAGAYVARVVRSMMELDPTKT